MAKKKAAKSKIDPNALKTRDLLMVALINGATKAAVYPDSKKEKSRNECRRRVRSDDE